MHGRNIFKSARNTPFSASCSDFPLNSRVVPCSHSSRIPAHLPPSLGHWYPFLHVHALICSVQLSACTPWVFSAHPDLQAADAVPDSSPSGDQVSQYALTVTPQRALNHTPPGHPPNFQSHQVCRPTPSHLASIYLNPAHRLEIHTGKHIAFLSPINSALCLFSCRSVSSTYIKSILMERIVCRVVCGGGCVCCSFVF